MVKAWRLRLLAFQASHSPRTTSTRDQVMMRSTTLHLLCMASMLCLSRGDSQVDIEIDDPIDLLAIESSVDPRLLRLNEIQQGDQRRLLPIIDAPYNFGGQRLTTNKDNEAYFFRVATPEGIRREERGHIDGSKVGSYEFVAPDGNVYSISFVADVNGFVAQGDHLPQPPALPPALQRFEDARLGRLGRNNRG